MSKLYKYSVFIFTVLISFILLVNSCSLFKTSTDVSSSYIPAVLTGGAGYETSSRGARLVTDGESAPAYIFLDDALQAQWETDYPGWSTVPKVATYFNNIFVQTTENFQNNFFGVADISDPVYSKEGTFGEDSIVRVDEAGQNWEVIDHEDSSQMLYLRYEETDDHIKAMRLFYNIAGGDNNEILEMYETASYKFIKVLWWSNVSSSADARPKINHFVSVTDKSTNNKKTTGRMMGESFEEGDFTSHTFSFSPGTTADTDYFTAEKGNPNVPMYAQDDYGFFNDVDYYTSGTTEYPATSGEFDEYIDPDLLVTLFAQGFTEAMWTDLKTKVTNMESVDYIDWDISSFE